MLGLTQELGSYRNIPAFLRGRGFTLAGEPLRPDYVTKDKLVDGLTPGESVDNVLHTFGRWEMCATKVEGGKTLVMVIYLVADDGPIARTSGKYATLLGGASLLANNVGGELREVITIASEETLAQKKHIRETVKTLNAEAKAQRSKTLYFAYPFYMFVAVIPEIPHVGRHEVISAAEAKAHMEMFYLEPSQIPTIFVNTDPPAVWCGARPGDFVRIWVDSETAGALVPKLRIGV